MIRALLVALRPTHWSKNAFVLAPLLFARRWEELASVQLALLATALWCATASSVYLFNDVLDREADRLHPVKRHRPIAAGTLPTTVALVVAGVLAVSSLVAGARFASPAVAVGLGAYLLLNLAYSVRLKTIPYLDVTLVATGFVLRVFTGARAIEVPASPWLLICSAGLALFLALSKRRAELARTEGSAKDARRVMGAYDLRHLDWLCRGTALLNTAAYLAYTLAPHPVAHTGDLPMIATVPFVAVGHLRYLHLVQGRGEGEDPTRLARRDPVLLAVTLGWTLACVLALGL